MLTTARLLLRRWRDPDRAPFAAMNADPEVMRFFPARLTVEQSDGFLDRIEAGFEQHGFGLWALEIRDTGQFIGFTGLALQTFPAHFTPAVEVGWRLTPSAWHQGFASEAARAALTYGFTWAGLDDIVSMTTVSNLASQAVMRRIGMTRDEADDFEHPRVPDDSPLKPHVLYRISRQNWADEQVSAP